jgi:hypothetical protein
MRLVYLYLTAYFLLLLAALVVLWQAGVLAGFGIGPVVLGFLAAVGLGILLALTTSRKSIHPGQ